MRVPLTLPRNSETKMKGWKLSCTKLMSDCTNNLICPKLRNEEEEEESRAQVRKILVEKEEEGMMRWARN